VVRGLGAQGAADGFARGNGVAQGKTTIRFAGGRHHHEGSVGSADRCFNVSRGGNAATGFGEELGKARLVDGGHATGDGVHLLGIEIDGVNGKAAGGEAGGHGGAEFAQTNYREGREHAPPEGAPSLA
jgi:hypothetical protein